MSTRRKAAAKTRGAKPKPTKATSAKATSAKATSAKATPATKEVRHVGIVVRSASQRALRTAAELADWLRRRDISVALDATCRKKLEATDIPLFEADAPYDLVIVLGGDGTLLSVARSVSVPILGVNLGRLGFLTELARKELYPSLVGILAGEFEVEERSLFDVALRRTHGEVAHYRAFNDAVIGKNALSSIVEIELQVGGKRVARYRCDGLIVSTPNGATAYNLSAGGPILYPSLPVAVLTPICPHTLTLRPIVVPDTETIEITLKTAREEVFLTVDGQEGDKMGYRDSVLVQRSASNAKLVRITQRTFYDSLREKLKWGG
ncbi:MAG: NAD(+)/NADH kinase [Acidobacteriota bacterium]